MGHNRRDQSEKMPINSNTRLARPISSDTRLAWSFCGFARSVDLGSFLYFSALICCLCSHFGFLQFFENDDVASVH
jgi:hypothetical protein